MQMSHRKSLKYPICKLMGFEFTEEEIRKSNLVYSIIQDTNKGWLYLLRNIEEYKEELNYCTTHKKIVKIPYNIDFQKFVLEKTFCGFVGDGKHYVTHDECETDVLKSFCEIDKSLNYEKLNSLILK